MLALALPAGKEGSQRTILVGPMAGQSEYECPP